MPTISVLLFTVSRITEGMSEKEDFDLDSALSSPGGSQSQGNKRSSSVFTYGTPGQHHNSKRKSKQVRK